MALRLLRNFGHLIRNFHIDSNMFDIKANEFEDNFYQYLQKYCSESLIALSLQGTFCVDCCFFELLDQPFPNLKMIEVGYYTIKKISR